MVRNIAIIVGIVLALGIVGHMDFEDAQQEEISYCENVRDKVWPDYNGTYKSECLKIFSQQRLTTSK